jgi:PBP1b-binding outer membrane lipoprotein LpoB
MKTSSFILCLLLAAMVLTGCSSLEKLSNSKVIQASDVVITDQRTVGNFSSINMGTIGNVIITQGDRESLTIKGSDNVVPLVKSTVSNGVLTINTESNLIVNGMNTNNLLTFTLVVKDLASLMVSGLGNVEMDKLSTSNLSATMSGAGRIKLDQLTADSLNVNVSGLGDIEIAGEVNSATINIPGAGNVSAGDLKIKTAAVSISGLGNATVWVTDQLNGTISGGGTVSYYGNPATNTQSTGLGSYKSLGSK